MVRLEARREEVGFPESRRRRPAEEPLERRLQALDAVASRRQPLLHGQEERQPFERLRRQLRPRLGAHHPQQAAEILAVADLLDGDAGQQLAGDDPLILDQLVERRQQPLGLEPPEQGELHARHRPVVAQPFGQQLAHRRLGFVAGWRGAAGEREQLARGRGIERRVDGERRRQRHRLVAELEHRQQPRQQLDRSDQRRRLVARQPQRHEPRQRRRQRRLHLRFGHALVPRHRIQQLAPLGESHRHPLAHPVRQLVGRRRITGPGSLQLAAQLLGHLGWHARAQRRRERHLGEQVVAQPRRPALRRVVLVHQLVGLLPTEVGGEG